MNPEQTGSVVQIDIQDEMQRSFITYAMSVIVSRALPDVRDGLKPVQRRILYTMADGGNTADKPFRKAAKSVGDVMGRFHPHSDTAIYDTLVRLAQEWNLRNPLIEGQGNFGSIDGDPPAAMRYTEARLSRLASEMLTDIHKETVDWAPNFDASEEEPTVLPSRFPNLMVNGSTGIAVGMATNIPPHNLGEVIDGLHLLIDNPEVTIEQLMEVVKGPDFPTGGLILGREGIRKAFMTGRGSIPIRAKAQIETLANGRNRIVVTEIPYLVNKSRLIERIAELVRDKRIDGITDLRDESDRTGLRLVMEVRRDANANVILNQLYKFTQLQQSFGVNFLALVDGRPRRLNLRDALYYYLEHQKEIIVRRTKFDLEKAEARAHIVSGLLRALDIIDEVINTIRGSNTVDLAKTRLMENFGFSETQAQHIVDMQLRRLTGLEREKLQTEYDELQETIAYLRAVLQSDQMVLSIIKQELAEIKEKFADPRRSRIVNDDGDIDIEDLIAEEDVVLTITHTGYIKRVTANTYRSQRRGGRGVTGMGTKDEDFVEHLFTTTTHHRLLFFTNQGRVYGLKAYQVPEASRTARGTAIVNLLQLQPGERVQTVIPVREVDEESFLFFATKQGYVKKTSITEFRNLRINGLNAITLSDDDEIVGVKLTSGNAELILVSSSGYAIRFHEEHVRSMGRTARGVIGMRLDPGAEIVGVDQVQPNSELLVITNNGMGKRTSLDEYRVTNRGGKGIKTINLTARNGAIVAVRVVRENEDLMLISSGGVLIRTPVGEIRQAGRDTQGVRVMNLDEGDSVVAAAPIAVREDDDEAEVE